MGRHRRPSKAASLVAGAPAAVAVGAMFVAPAAHAQAHSPARPEPATTIVSSTDNLKPTIRQSVARAVAFTTVTVHRGNTLSGIAGTDCHNPADWSGIAAANHSQVKNPNLIYPGERLALDCRTANVSLPVVAVARTSDGDGDGDHDSGDGGWTAPHTQYHSHAVVNTVVAGTYHGSGSMQQCIISRESGGNSQIWNASGHYGLYQFSSSTWAAHGGNPADFGHASVAEQNQVYYNTVAADGYSDWAPYDGC